MQNILDKFGLNLPNTDTIQLIRRAWDRFGASGPGRRAFSVLIGRMVPYSGTIKPLVLELRTGYAKIEMRDRPETRNHLKSAHAIALANLGEISCGLALNYQIPAGYGAILKKIEIEYFKKGRGTLISECSLGELSFDGTADISVQSVIRDEKNDIVAKATTVWKTGPREKKA